MPSVYKRINQGYIDADREAQKDVVRKQFRFVAQQNERNLEPTLLDNITKFNIDKYFDDFRDEVQRGIDAYLSKAGKSYAFPIILSYNLLTNYIKNYARMNKLDQREKADIQDKFDTLKPLVQQVINIETKDKSANLPQLLEIYDNIDSYYYVPVGVDKEVEKEYEDKIKEFEQENRIPVSDMKKQVKILYDEFFVKDEDGISRYDELSKKEKQQLDKGFKYFNTLYSKYQRASPNLKQQIFNEMSDIYQRFIYESSGAVAELPEEISPEMQEVPTIGITEEGEYEGYPVELPYRESQRVYDEEQKKMLEDIAREEGRKIRAEKGVSRGALSREEQKKTKSAAEKRLYEDKPREYLAVEYPDIETKLRFEPDSIDSNDLEILKNEYRSIYNDIIRTLKEEEEQRIEQIRAEKERSRMVKGEEKQQKRIEAERRIREKKEKLERQKAEKEENRRARLERRESERVRREEERKRIAEERRRRLPIEAAAAAEARARAREAPPAAAAAAAERKEGEGKPKRARGRPRKKGNGGLPYKSNRVVRKPPTEAQQKAIIKENQLSGGMKAKRGRPRKQAVVEVVVETVPKKGRGRPRKQPISIATPEIKINRMKKKKV
jgi:hypothetical protein